MKQMAERVDGILTAEHSKYTRPLDCANCSPACALITRRSSRSTLLATSTPIHEYQHVSRCKLEAMFPSNATHARKVRNKRNERKRVRNKRSWRNGRSNNYPQPPPVLGRLLLQFNAAQQKW